MTGLFKNIFRGVLIALVNELKMLADRRGIDMKNVDDMRESPTVALIDLLKNTGIVVDTRNAISRLGHPRKNVVEA